MGRRGAGLPLLCVEVIWIIKAAHSKQTGYERLMRGINEEDSPFTPADVLADLGATSQRHVNKDAQPRPARSWRAGGEPSGTADAN